MISWNSDEDHSKRGILLNFSSNNVEERERNRTETKCQTMTLRRKLVRKEGKRNT